jgi:hypothetical protein
VKVARYDALAPGRGWGPWNGLKSAHPRGGQYERVAPGAKTTRFLKDDPRFLPTFERLQAEIKRVQVHVTLATLRPLCLAQESPGTFWHEGKEVTLPPYWRQATDDEIAATETAFAGPKQIAAAAGFNAMRAAARRLTRYYGLRSVYAPH